MNNCANTCVCHFCRGFTLAVYLSGIDNGVLPLRKTEHEKQGRNLYASERERRHWALRLLHNTTLCLSSYGNGPWKRLSFLLFLVYCDAAFLSQDGLCYRINLESSKTLPRLVFYGLYLARGNSKIISHRQELLHESQVKNFGHFLKKSLPDLDLSLSLNSVNELSTSTFVGFPTLNSSLWQNLQLCAKNYAAKADSDVLCRSLGHLGGGQR